MFRSTRWRSHIFLAPSETVNDTSNVPSGCSVTEQCGDGVKTDGDAGGLGVVCGTAGTGGRNGAGM